MPSRSVLKHASLLKYCVRKHREPDRSGWLRWIVGSGQAEVNRRRKDKDLLRRAELRKRETEHSNCSSNSGPPHPNDIAGGYWQEVARWQGWDEWEEEQRAVQPEDE